MLIKLTCPGCGRTLAVPRTDAGLPALCNACGRRLQIPHVEQGFDEGTSADSPTSPPAPPRGPAVFDATDSRWRGLAAGAAGGTSRQPEVFQPPPPGFFDRPPRRPRHWPLLASVTAAAVLVVLGLGWLVTSSTRRPDPWIAANRAKILAMADEVDSLLLAGKPRLATQRLSDVERLLGDHRVDDDPALHALRERVAGRRRQLISLTTRESAAVESTTGPSLARAMPPSAPTTTASTRTGSASVADDDLDPAHITTAGSEPTTSMPASAPTITPAVASTPPKPRLRLTSLRVRRQTTSDDPVTDDRIGRSIQRGADWLIARFPPQVLSDKNSKELRGGGGTHAQDALCVYALLQCGQAIRDPRLNVRSDFIKVLLARLDRLEMEPGVATYGRALRATALGVYDRPADRPALMADAGWLLKVARGGAYTYAEFHDKTAAWDNSNSQYGLLGVWAAAEAGLVVPRPYWAAVERHWTETQLPDGQWDYGPNDRTGRLSMTLAGIASLFVCHDYLDPGSSSASSLKLGRPPFPPALQNGLIWLEDPNRKFDLLNESYWGYVLYGFERVGLASGFKFIGDHDWYREFARLLMERQDPDGSWDHDEVQTSFALLFLSRGRHPIMMNKLRYAGNWANRPRDVANLARFASRDLERPLNWQVVPLSHDWTDWTDGPILCLSSHVAPVLSDGEVEKLRQYVQAGGLLFTQADGGSREFNAFARDLARKLFPDYPLIDAPPDHWAYTMLYHVDPDAAPPLQIVGNGIRTLMVHCPDDIAQHWQRRAVRAHPEAFQVGVNLFLYCSGKSDLKNRLASVLVPEPEDAAGGSIRIARLRYPGNWDPEPGAWPRFARWFQSQTDCRIDLSEVEPGHLEAGSAALAHLTGTTASSVLVSDSTAAALRRYVQAGGTLLIDVPGPGAGPFAADARHLLAKAFPDTVLQPLPEADLPIASLLEGMDPLPTDPTSILRPFALLHTTRDRAMLQGFTFGRGRAYFAPVDLTSGLLGTSTWGIVGYSPAYSQALLKNILLTSAAGPDAP